MLQIDQSNVCGILVESLLDFHRSLVSGLHSPRSLGEERRLISQTMVVIEPSVSGISIFKCQLNISHMLLASPYSVIVRGISLKYG